MKKLLVAVLTVMMLAPTGVQAKGTVKVVDTVDNAPVIYNKDGLITQFGDISFKYKNGKISSMKNWDTSFKSYAVTYNKGRVATINKQKVSVAYKKMKYHDENYKNLTTPKGMYYTFKYARGKQDTDMQYLMNKKGQLLASFNGEEISYYKYDRKGYAYKWMIWCDFSKYDRAVCRAKNKYKGSLLVSRSEYEINGGGKSKYSEKYTYKTIRVRNVNAVKKQQMAFLNNQSTLAFIFVQ